MYNEHRSKKVKLNKCCIICLVLCIYLVSQYYCNYYKNILQINNSITKESYVAAFNFNEKGISWAVQKVIPSVVGIVSTRTEKNVSDVREVHSIGSGIIIDKAGYILTSKHVTDSNNKVLSIMLYDGRRVDGTTIWTDSLYDLAIIKIHADKISQASFGNSSELKIGETAIAIGNPLGMNFQRTVTAGIISALNRTIEISKGVYMQDLIQTDASINPGNSGGPLININGEIIGINTAKVSSAEGIGFAVPINIVKPVLKSIKNSGKFITPVMGIIGFDKEMAGYTNVLVDKGIYIYNVTAGSGADIAGIKKGDILLTLNGKELKCMTDLKEGLYKAGVGSTVKIKARTLNGEKIFEVKLSTQNQ